MQPFQIIKYDLQRMNARPYPQKKDVDSIILNASLHPLKAPTKKNQLNDFCNNNTIAETSVCKSFCM